MLKISIAKTPEQIDDVLKLRHQIFVAEGKYAKTGSGRIVERFDAFPSTTNLIATQNNKLIGGMRLTLGSQKNIPSDKALAAEATLATEVQVIGCSMYCVKPDYRNTQVMMGLLLMASYLGLSHGVTHIIAPTDATVIKKLKQEGFRAVQNTVEVPYTSLNIEPLLLSIRQDLRDFFAKFAEQNQIESFIHSYECAFYDPGEYVIRAGEVGDCAFVLVDGELEVLHPGENPATDTIKTGAVFGEMALLTDQRRSASILAKTQVRVMMLEKSVFLEHLSADPTMALQMLKSMSSRMQHLIKHRPLTPV